MDFRLVPEPRTFSTKSARGCHSLRLNRLPPMALFYGSTIKFARAVSTGFEHSATFNNCAIFSKFHWTCPANRMVIGNSASMPRPDAALIDFIVRANTYLAALTDGSAKTLTQIANEQGTDVSEVSRLLPFAFLAPHLVESILAGNQPFELGALRLGRISDLPVNWQQQAELLGF